MNELVFGSSEATELRAQLLKERRKRVAAEERCRALEQQLKGVKPNGAVPDIVVTPSIRESKVR